MRCTDGSQTLLTIAPSHSHSHSHSPSRPHAHRRTRTHATQTQTQTQTQSHPPIDTQRPHTRPHTHTHTHARARAHTTHAHTYTHACTHAHDLQLPPHLPRALPVAGAGGIFDGRGVAAVLTLGAEAAWVGTRFVAATEAGAGPMHQNAILSSTSDETIRTLIYSGRPMRVKKTVRRVSFCRALCLSVRCVCVCGGGGRTQCSVRPVCNINFSQGVADPSLPTALLMMLVPPKEYVMDWELHRKSEATALLVQGKRVHKTELSRREALDDPMDFASTYPLIFGQACSSLCFVASLRFRSFSFFLGWVVWGGGKCVTLLSRIVSACPLFLSSLLRRHTWAVQQHATRESCLSYLLFSRAMPFDQSPKGGGITEIKSAAQIVDELVSGAVRALTSSHSRLLSAHL